MPIAIQDTPHALLTELSIILCKTIATWLALRSELATCVTTASNPLCVATTIGVFIKDTGKTTQAVPYSFVSPTPHCLYSQQYPCDRAFPCAGISLLRFVIRGNHNCIFCTLRPVRASYITREVTTPHCYYSSHSI